MHCFLSQNYAINKNPTKTWDTRVNISVFDTPKFGIAFTVKYIIRPPNTPPNNNL